ncbi:TRANSMEMBRANE GTPASE FZO [Salix purpurea]|uniref:TRANSMEMBRANE GTPASE FZO n=1 Tax=Salix purpurea TaxID=77065 RepID=A0A9Q0PBJ1_SALPP|nr:TRANSMEMBRANE GTPASE FZO [Salix purpurea]
MPATSKIQNDIIGPALTDAQKLLGEYFLGTFGGVGAAGLSASLLTSVLPTTLEDLVLGLCTAGGIVFWIQIKLSACSSCYHVFSNARRRAMVDQVNRIADGLAREVEEAMQKDLMKTVGNVENFVRTIGKSYQDAAQKRLDKLLDLQEELSNADKKLRTLRIEIQNANVS